MKNKIFCFFNYFLFSSVLFSQQSEKSYKTEYAFVLVIDGPRYSETYGDSTCKLSPILCDSLRYEGAFFETFMNNGPTYTVPGHAAIVTGNYQRISNSGTVLPRNPSIFQYFLDAKKSSKNDAFVVASKGKLDVLVNTTNKSWHNKFLASTYCGPNGSGIGYGSDKGTFEKVTQLVSSPEPPHLLLINLLAVDVYGHASNWKKYQESITVCDAYASNLWEMIQSNPTLKDKTTLFITNDHGRHLDGVKSGFISHGDKCDGCKHISLLVLGPDTPKGVTVKKERELIDIPKSISQLLNFTMPTCKGTFLQEAFKSN
jgi:arylsulfatase A-like enzyme